MKILLISDTHGDISKVMMILERIKDIDWIVHCGDYQSDAWMLEDSTGIPVTCAAGNCDGPGGNRKVLETPAGKLLITHGHMEGAGWTYNNLIYAAEEEGDCIAVCFGHTHVPFCEDFGGLWLVNPGSLTHPRGGSKPAYAVLRCEDGMFHATLADFDTLLRTAPSPGATLRTAPAPNATLRPEKPAGKAAADSSADEATADKATADSSAGEAPAGKAANKNSSKKKKTKGGFLRNLLNYSDRF